MPTQVAFVDRLGVSEEGDDQGGLTAEMFSLFFREVCRAARSPPDLPSLCPRSPIHLLLGAVAVP